MRSRVLVRLEDEKARGRKAGRGDAPRWRCRTQTRGKTGNIRLAERFAGGPQLCPDVWVKLCRGIQSKRQEHIAAKLPELSCLPPVDAAGREGAARLGPLGQRFDYFVYPNRDQDLSEGEGTTAHVQMLVIRHLIENLPPGPR